MIPIDPMSFPFCVLFQSRTAVVTHRQTDETNIGKIGALTIEGEESECEFNTREDDQEEEMEPLQGLEEFDAS